MCTSSEAATGAGSPGPGGLSASKTRRDVRESSSRNRTFPSRTPAYRLVPRPELVTASGVMARFRARNASALALETPPSSSAAATMDLRDCVAPARRSRALALRTSMSSGAGAPIDPAFAVMRDLPSESPLPHLSQHSAQHYDDRGAGEHDRQHIVARPPVERGQRPHRELGHVRHQDQDDERPDAGPQ